jgi:hypothetical protein
MGQCLLSQAKDLERTDKTSSPSYPRLDFPTRLMKKIEKGKINVAYSKECPKSPKVGLF